MTDYRKALIEDSNNSENPNKNICTEAICKAFGVHNNVRYLHTIDDCERAFRKDYDIVDVTPRFSGQVISKIRSCLHHETEEFNALGYMVFVYMGGPDRGHVILLDKKGKTKIDTMNLHKGFDSRRIEIIGAICPKGDK